MNAIHPCDLPLEQLARECRVRFDRRSGPGGQHRNKVETAVVVVHEPTGIAAEAAERRSQQANREMAMFRLRVNLALRVRSVRPDGKPSECWCGRRTGQRIRVSDQHDDFPTLLAEALDGIAQHEYDVAAAADSLGVTSSQLVRLLKLEPRAMAGVNDQRAVRGLHALK